MSKRFQVNVTIDHDLLLEFFLTFARFEFALKAAGFFKSNVEWASPDWRRFGGSIDLNAACQDPKCAEAVEYFGLHPPWRQVVADNEIVWDSSLEFKTLERMDQVLDLVRRVRNNLFHGGRFNDEIHSGLGRNEMLLRHSLSILHRCLKLSQPVAEAYETATL